MARVNVGGGCAGTGAGAEDEAVFFANAGSMKFQPNSPYRLNEIVTRTLPITHPIYRGLQTDAKTKQTKYASTSKILILNLKV